MVQNRIFNGVPSTNSLNSTDSFSRGVGFYIVAPDSTFELEIDLWLQIRLTPSNQRLVPLLTGYKITTEEFVIIPAELKNISEETYLAFTTDIQENLEVWVIEDDTITLQEISGKLDIIDDKLSAVVRSQLGQNQALQLISGTLGLGLSVPTSGASLTLPSSVGTVLAQSTQELLLVVD